MARFDYSSQTQLLRQLRRTYKTATGETAAKIARYLAARTDAELQDAFPAITTQQLANMRNRMAAIIVKANTTRAALADVATVVGE